jgi:uncharacterized protein with von Willebrand factor type A (vWA) domain
VAAEPYDAVDSLVGLAATLRSSGVGASTDRVHAAVQALALLDPRGGPTCTGPAG